MTPPSSMMWQPATIAAIRRCGWRPATNNFVALPRIASGGHLVGGWDFARHAVWFRR
jgi:hypothetical protein